MVMGALRRSSDTGRANYPSRETLPNVVGVFERLDHQIFLQKIKVSPFPNTIQKLKRCSTSFSLTEYVKKAVISRVSSISPCLTL